MGKKYQNPPIVEALCEFQFEPDSSWDLAIPGLVYEKLRDVFPKRRQSKGLALNILAGPEAVEQRVRTTDLMQFLREDEKALVQVGPHLLTVNHLKPYSSWQEFSPLIKKGIEAYCAVAEPKGIHRIGLRYINYIEIPERSIKLENYFEFYPFTGPDLPKEHGLFIVGIQVPCEASRDILKIALTSANTQTPDTSAIILDLDYFLAKPKEVAPDDVFKWMDVAHDRVEKAFEACITDRLRQAFVEATE